MYCKSLQALPTQTAISQRRYQLAQSMGGCATGGCATGACPTQLACNTPTPAPAPACQTCAPAPASYASAGPICGPQPKPLDPPGWAMTPAPCVPQSASPTLLGNNTNVPTPAQTAQRASYSPSVSNQAAEEKEDLTANKQTEPEPAAPEQDLAESKSSEPKLAEPKLAEPEQKPTLSQQEPAAPTPAPVAAKPTKAKILPGVPIPSVAENQNTDLY